MKRPVLLLPRKDSFSELFLAFIADVYLLIIRIVNLFSPGKAFDRLLAVKLKITQPDRCSSAARFHTFYTISAKVGRVGRILKNIFPIGFV
ncbi:hypothetical protein ABIC12_001758 [Pantoea agglomerans]|nr:hypothetical protein [Pantoea agglomerans]